MAIGTMSDLGNQDNYGDGNNQQQNNTYCGGPKPAGSKSLKACWPRLGLNRPHPLNNRSFPSSSNPSTSCRRGHNPSRRGPYKDTRPPYNSRGKFTNRIFSSSYDVDAFDVKKLQGHQSTQTSVHFTVDDSFTKFGEDFEDSKFDKHNNF